MLRFANAKINLGLHITEKRLDGYHNIETIFYPVKLYDAIEVLPRDAFGFHVAANEPMTDLESDNICVRAYRLLADMYRISPCDIHLLKNIPVGAGLGGGSSDAVAVLEALNEQFELKLPDVDLQRLAARLGADCPFFVQNQPVYATGIGVDFEAIDIDLDDYTIIIVKPAVSISTAEAYRDVTPKPSDVDLRRAIKLPIQEWKYHIVNDFEHGVFYHHPEIQSVKNQLYEQGAIYAAMSGSGSALYGIFEEPTILADLPDSCKVYYPVEL